MRRFAEGLAKTGRKVLSILMAVMMCLALMPAVAFADEEESVEEIVLQPSAVYVTVDYDATVRMAYDNNRGSAASSEKYVYANSSTQIATLDTGSYILQYKSEAGEWVVPSGQQAVTVSGDGVQVNLCAQIPAPEPEPEPVVEEESVVEDVSSTEAAVAEVEPSNLETMATDGDEATVENPTEAIEDSSQATEVNDENDNETSLEADELEGEEEPELEELVGNEEELNLLEEYMNADMSLMGYELMAAGYGTLTRGAKDWPVYNDGKLEYETQMIINGQVVFCTNFKIRCGWNQTYYASSLPASQALRWGLYQKYFNENCSSQWYANLYTAYAIWVDTGAIENAGFYPYYSNFLSTYYPAAQAYYEANKDYYTATGTQWVCSGYQSAASNFQLYRSVGDLQLVKTSANPACTNNNALYSFEGTTYAVYDDQELAKAARDRAAIEQFSEDENAVAIIDVAEDGTSEKVFNLVPGTYYVVEIQAGTGYLLDSQVYGIVVNAGRTTTFNAVDVPINDPDGVFLHKQNSAGVNAPTGDTRLEGALYAFDYYEGYYYSVDELPATPTRHWVLQTNALGYAGLPKVTSSDMSMFVEGDAIIFDETGRATMPLGTLVMHEIQAPAGYLLSDEYFISRYVLDPTAPLGGRWEGDVTPNAYNELELIANEESKVYDLEIYKEIQGTDEEVSPEGITFEVVLQSTQEVVCTLVIGADGKATTAVEGEKGHLAWGTYEIREVEESLPKNELGEYLIQPWSVTSGTNSNIVATVELKDNLEPLDCFEVTVVDYGTTPTIVEKQDAQTGEGVADTVFTMYRYTGDVQMEDGKVGLNPSTLDATADYWEVYKVATTDAAGIADFGRNCYGIYMMVESAPNANYMSANETEGIDSSDPRATARIFVLDKEHNVMTQTWEDERIIVECNIHKSTIDVTSAGLVSQSASRDGQSLSNVGIEEYRYDVTFDNGNTNTFADEYWVTDELNMTASPYDLRVTTIVLPVVVGDTDGRVDLLIRTNMSEGSNYFYSANAGNNNHSTSFCDGSVRFNGAGWIHVGNYSATSQTKLSVASLGLAEDEYITGITLLYGAVEPKFATTHPLSYMVTATHELSIGVVLPNTATSHITRNWALRDGSTTGLYDDATSSVETRVIGTFINTWTTKFTGTFNQWAGRLDIPQMGDTFGDLVYGLGGLALISAIALLILGRKPKKEGSRR